MDSSQYAELFLTESREHVSAINHSLLELERGVGGDEPVGAIFRAVHTIKGMSATMGYSAVASLSHELETLLDRVRRGVRAIDATGVYPIVALIPLIVWTARKIAPTGSSPPAPRSSSSSEWLMADTCSRLSVRKSSAYWALSTLVSPRGDGRRERHPSTRWTASSTRLG